MKRSACRTVGMERTLPRSCLNSPACSLPAMHMTCLIQVSHPSSPAYVSEFWHFRILFSIPCYRLKPQRRSPNILPIMAMPLYVRSIFTWKSSSLSPCGGRKIPGWGGSKQFCKNLTKKFVSKTKLTLSFSNYY